MSEEEVEVIDFQGKPLTLSRHAQERFLERFNQIDPSGPPKNLPKTIGRLLSKAVSEDIGARGRIQRLLNHGCKPAEYYRNSGWRFVIVVDNDEYTLVTAERISQV